MKLLKSLMLFSSVLGTVTASEGKFFVGAQIGTEKTNVSFSDAKKEIGKHFSTFTTKETKKFGLLGGLSLGYLHKFSNSPIFLGGEVYANLSNTKASEKFSVENYPRGVSTISGFAEYTIKHKGTLGAALMAGSWLTPEFAPYVKVGFENTRFQPEYVETYKSSSGGYAKIEEKLKSVSISGVLIGAGAFYKLTDQIYVGGEYGYTSYQTKKIKGKLLDIGNIKPKTHKLVARVIYTF